MKIIITENAVKEFNKINNPFRDTIKNKIDILSKQGLDYNGIKALTGEFKGYYRLRVGDYRIIFNIQDDTIGIVSIHHRKNVYE